MPPVRKRNKRPLGYQTLRRFVPRSEPRTRRWQNQWHTSSANATPPLARWRGDRFAGVRPVATPGTSRFAVQAHRVVNPRRLPVMRFGCVLAVTLLPSLFAQQVLAEDSPKQEKFRQPLEAPPVSTPFPVLAKVAKPEPDYWEFLRKYPPEIQVEILSCPLPDE